jgi:hypothetical protein
MSNCENAEKAIEAFGALGVELDDKQAKEAYIHLLAGRGFSKSQGLPFKQRIRVAAYKPHFVRLETPI